MTGITEKTKLSIGLLLSIMAGVFWISEIYYRGIESAKAIDGFQLDMKAISKDIGDIKTDVAITKSDVATIKQTIKGDSHGRYQRNQGSTDSGQ